MAWLFVHLFFLIGFRNKISVLLRWGYSYVSYRRGSRIITGLEFRKGALAEAIKAPAGKAG
jgi:NADH dehydrogenase